MKTLFLLFMIPLLPLSCFKNRINYSYDEFENKQKMMMEHVYYAKKDFSGKQRVSIRYYKEIDENGQYSISGKISFHSHPTEGKLKSTFLIRLNNKIFETNFYDCHTEKIKHKQTKSEHHINYEKF